MRDSNVSVISVLYNLFDYFNDFFLQAVANAINAIPERVLSAKEKEAFMTVGEEGVGDPQGLLQKNNSNLNWFEHSMLSLSGIARRRVEHA